MKLRHLSKRLAFGESRTASILALHKRSAVPSPTGARISSPNKTLARSTHAALLSEPLFWAATLACIVPLVLMGISSRALHYLNCDTAQLIAASGALLDGRIPYLGIVDTNPPMIVYLHTPITAIARAVGLHPLYAFMLAGSLLGFLTVAVVGWLLFVVANRSIRSTLVLASATAAFALYEWGTQEHFGQREHLFVLLYAPLLCLRLARWLGAAVNPRLAVALGVLGALGACIKPHFLLIVAAPELVWSLQRRSLRPLVAPELTSAVAVVLGYTAHLLLLPVAARHELFDFVLPLMRYGWSSYYTPMHVIVFDHCGSIIAAVVAAVGALSVGRHSGLRSLAAPAVAMTAAALVVFLVQHRGWSYQFVPVTWGSFVLGAIAVDGVLQRLLRDETDVLRLETLVAFGLLAFSLGMAQDKRVVLRERPDVPLERAVLQYTQASDSVLVLHDAVPPTYPALAVLERPLATRYLFAFPVPLIARARMSADPEIHSFADWAEQRYLRATLEDIERYEPALILMSRHKCAECRGGIELQEFFTSWPALRAELNTHYLEIEDMAGFRAYRRLVASDAPLPG